jgi:VanZ family protein
VLLTLPGSSFPKENWLDKIAFDKWIHIVMFFIMVVLWCKAMSGRMGEMPGVKKVFAWIALAGLLYGIGMEFIQGSFISRRSFDTGDIVADGVGCLAGFLFSSRAYIKK